MAGKDPDKDQGYAGDYRQCDGPEIAIDVVFNHISNEQKVDAFYYPGLETSDFGTKLFNQRPYKLNLSIFFNENGTDFLEFNIENTSHHILDWKNNRIHLKIGLTNN